MSMGGGILRTVARAVAPTTSSGFCSACTGSQVQARPSSLRPSCRACSGTALSQQTSSSGNQADFDDWELAGDYLSEGASGYTLDDLEGFDNRFWPVWGLPPSAEEASSATAELQSAFYAYDSLSSDDSTCTSSELMAEEFKGCVIEPARTSMDMDMNEKLLRRREWVEPRVHSSREIQVATRSPVQEAFQLLRNDPNVKSTVISLVSDPDVWHVMMKNKKVQELKRIFQKSQDQSEVSMDARQEQQPSKHEKKHGCLDGISFLLSSIAGLSRHVAWKVQDDLFKIAMAIFSLVIPSKEKSGQEEDPFEKAMRSSMVLAVLVVTVVLMKRMP